MPSQFLSTLSLRRATHAADISARREASISIHALLAESDLCAFVSLFGVFLFLSTLSLRRATRLCTILYSCPGNFYPRSPCGERPTANTGATTSDQISIHALLAESDKNQPGKSNKLTGFLSTLSLRRATVTFLLYNNRRQDFYPRSPCGERRTSPFSIFWICHFYPRSPCGERLGLDGRFKL